MRVGESITGRDAMTAPDDAAHTSRIGQWFLAETAESPGAHTGPHGNPTADRRVSWWRVMCLTVLDYFSTLGY